MSVYIIVGIVLAVMVGTYWTTYYMIKSIVLGLMRDMLNILKGEYDESE